MLASALSAQTTKRRKKFTATVLFMIPYDLHTH